MEIRRVDANQLEIVHKLLRHWVISVADTHLVGGGFPDIVVGYAGVDYLVELKSSKKAKLRKSQIKFRDTWKGAPIHRVDTYEDVCAIIGVRPIV